MLQKQATYLQGCCRVSELLDRLRSAGQGLSSICLCPKVVVLDHCYETVSFVLTQPGDHARPTVPSQQVHGSAR